MVLLPSRAARTRRSSVVGRQSRAGAVLSRRVSAGAGRSLGALLVRQADTTEAPVVHRIMQAAFATLADALPVASGAHTETVDDVRAVMARGGAVLCFVDDIAVGSARFTLDEPDVM